MAEIQGRLAVQAEKELKACCSGIFKRNYADVTANVLQDAWHFFFKENVFKDSVAQANIYSLSNIFQDVSDECTHASDDESFVCRSKLPWPNLYFYSNI